MSYTHGTSVSFQYVLVLSIVTSAVFCNQTNPSHAQAALGESALAGYLNATLLIQCSIRRTLAIVEASARRRLRDNQARSRAWGST